MAARLRPWHVTLLAFDPYVTPERTAELGVEPVSLDELLAKSDVVSLHAPGGSETKHLIGERQLAAMKKGAILVNCARGPLVDEAALVDALDSGQLAGAALDVFSVEPPKDFSLMKHPKVLCTPHLGASTVEAQDRVAVETVEMLAEALKGSPFVAAVNLPFPAGGDPHAALPWMRLAETVGAFVGQAMPEAPKQLTVTLAGIPEAIRKACVVAAVKGVVSTFAEGVNIVNAVSLAKLNGISVSDSVREDAGGYASLVTVAAGDRSASGTLFGDRHGRIVARQRSLARVLARGDAPRDREPGRAGRRRAHRNAARVAGSQHLGSRSRPGERMAGRPPSFGSTRRTARSDRISSGRSRRSRASIRRGS